MQIHKIDGTSFNARRVAVAKVKLPNCAVNYDIYKVSSVDGNYLSSIKSQINLKELWYSLKEKDYEDWEFILHKALAFSSLKFGYLVAQANKPCGILNARENGSVCDVDWVATWPLEKNKKKPLAGKIMFLQLFRDILKQKGIQQIKLTSIKGDPFGAFSKYCALNFVPYGGDNHCELMKLQCSKLADTIDKFNPLVEFIPKEDEDVDLMDVLEMPS